MPTALAPPVPTTAVAADLILVRMALPAKTPPAPKRVREGVGKLLGTPFPAAEFDTLRQNLAADKLLVKGRGKSFAITSDGRERAARFLGLDEMPTLRWDQVITNHLFPKLAGLSAKETAEVKKGGNLAAFILKTKYGFTSTAAPALRLKLIHDQLASAAPPLPAVVPHAVSEEPFDLTTFANTVLKLARVSPPEDRFHDNKVFIAPLWRSSQREPNFPRLTLSEFKTRLIEANTDALVNLSRADEVQSMDPQAVQESATKHPVADATFHFVLISRDRA